jgi:predicted RNA-binding protein with PIN domain
MDMRTPLLLVDGYNVIAASPRYRHLADGDIESARAALLGDVVTLSQGRYRAVVVFDGAGNPHSDGAPHHVPGALVVFSAYGVDADSVIEQLSHRHRERGEEVVVVTSDAQTQWTVLGPGVSRMSAAEFVSEVEAGAGTWQEHTPSGSTRQTLDSRIDPAVRATLSRWARGRETP